MRIPREFEIQNLRVCGWENVHTSRTLEESRNKLLSSLEAKVLMRREQPFPVKWKAPASWWQHFKRDVFPGWLLERFPVREKEHTRELEVKTLFPHLQLVKSPGRVPDMVTILVEGCPVGTVENPVKFTPRDER